MNSLVNRLATDIYGDEYSGALAVPTGSRALNMVQHAIDSKAGDVTGSYTQAYAGNYFGVATADNFMCYKVRTTPGSPKFEKQEGLALGRRVRDRQLRRQETGGAVRAGGAGRRASGERQRHAPRGVQAQGIAGRAQARAADQHHDRGWLRHAHPRHGEGEPSVGTERQGARRPRHAARRIRRSLQVLQGEDQRRRAQVRQGRAGDGHRSVPDQPRLRHQEAGPLVRAGRTAGGGILQQDQPPHVLQGEARRRAEVHADRGVDPHRQRVR